MDRFCTICSFQPKTYAGLAKYTARYRKVHICAADGLSSTMTVYNHIEKDKNANLAIADSISDALDICAKDDLIRRKGPLSTSTQTSNHVDTFGLDFAFSFAAYLSRLKADQHFFVYQNILSLIAFIISYRPFADKLSTKHNSYLYQEITLLAKFIPTTKIRDPFLKTLENAAKSRILLACADGRIRQCYPTICAILRCLNKGHDDFVYPINCFRWKHHNFNIHVSLATDTLHLLLKGLIIKMLDFMQDILDDIYPSSRKTWDNSTTLVTQESSKQKAIIQQLIAVVSLLFVSKAPFALHFIRAVCDLVTLAQYKSYDEDTLAYIQGALERINHALTHIIQDIRIYGALDSICTRANSEAHYITIVKQFYSITNKKEYILQICLHNSRRTALLAANYATVVKQSRPSTTLIPRIQPHSTKLPLSEVAANIAISNFTHAAAVFDRLDVDLSWVGCMSVQIHPSIKCWRSSGKRHNDPEHCDKEVLYLILIIIDYTRYDKDGKHMAYIRAFSEVLLFNNNRQIDNTTGMLSVRRRAWNAAPKRRILQAFKFYDLSTIICLVHLVPRDLPNSITYTTMSYYVNNYID
ncbi:hypothetical protein HBI81_175490 [Parastagonospora nodorum]|nr:hypothetical protein HBI81_175490 [Parastagonospora nodorum]